MPGRRLVKNHFAILKYLSLYKKIFMVKWDSLLNYFLFIKAFHSNNILCFGQQPFFTLWLFIWILFPPSEDLRFSVPENQECIAVERIPCSVYKQTPVYHYFKISQGTLKLLIVPAGKVLGGRALGTRARDPRYSTLQQDRSLHHGNWPRTPGWWPWN